MLAYLMYRLLYSHCCHRVVNQQEYLRDHRHVRLVKSWVCPFIFVYYHFVDRFCKFPVCNRWRHFLASSYFLGNQFRKIFLWNPVSSRDEHRADVLSFARYLFVHVALFFTCRDSVTQNKLRSIYTEDHL